MKNQILVWDLPTRVFHWGLVSCFVGLFVTGDSERWRDVHSLLGYTFLGLLAFRIVWGFVGSRYARFREFIRGPKDIAEYLKSLMQRNPIHYLGHNPAGALAIILLLVLGLGSGITGWMALEEIGGEAFEELHEVFANAMLAVVFLHVAGVLISSFLHRENLARAMVTGKKAGSPSQAIARSYWIIGLLLLISVAACWVWAVSGQAPWSGESSGYSRGTDTDD